MVVDIATKFDYWYLNVKHTLKDPVDIATKFDSLWEYYMSIEKIGTSEY
jgi:hypothetical protein